MTASLEDRLRTELHDEAAAIELDAGYVTSTVEQVLVRRRRRRVQVLAIAAGVIAVIALAGVALVNQTRDDTTPPVVDQDTIQTLRDTEHTRLDALVDADMPVLERLHADDFQVIPPTGYPLTRHDILGAIASGDLDFKAFDPVTQIEVRLYGDAAVLRYQAHIDVISTGDGRLTHGAWLTCLYEKRANNWQLVWEQTTAIGAFPPPKGP